MHSDSESYAPSTIGSTDTPQVATPPPEKRKMQVEVVIPIPAVLKHKTRSSRLAAVVASPARSDSSISLGTNWHISPQKRRRRTKKASALGMGELSQSKGKQAMSATLVRFQSTRSAPNTARQPENPPYPRPSALRVNLDSARLDHILAQERSRDYNRNLFTPPGSGDIAVQDVDERMSRGSPLSKIGSQLYELATANEGSSTGPGTQGWLKTRSTGLNSQDQIPNLQRQGHTPSAFPPSPPKAPGDRPALSQDIGAFGVPRKEHISAPSPPKEHIPSLPNVAFTDPDYDHWARVGLRVALEELVDVYGFPMDVVEKVYESKGNIEETDRFLGKWRYMMEDAINDSET